MNKKFFVAAALLFLLAFAIPIEHKYDKLFRFFSLTLIPQGLTVSPNYDKQIYFYASDLIALALLFLGLFWFRIPPKRFFGHPLWIIFLCAIGSILISPFAHYPIAYVRLLQLLTPILLFSFIAFAFNEEERSKITKVILIAIVASGLFQAGIAIVQYFHQAPLGLRLLGETNQISTFMIADASRWFLDKFSSRLIYTTVMMRAAGTLPHANVLGGFMVLSLITTYALIMLTQKRKWLLIATLPFQLFALLLSFSRAALLAWIISTMVWFGLIVYKRGIKSVRTMAIFVAFSFAIFMGVLLNQYFSRGGLLNYNATAKNSDSIRHFHQNVAFKIMKDHPLLGIGFSQFSERSVDYFPEDTAPHIKATGPHNIFLFLACETGLISLAALLSFLAILFWAATRTPITIETATFAALMIGFLFIGCCDFYLILFQQGKLMFFLVAGLLAAHVQRRNAKLCVDEFVHPRF